MPDAATDSGQSHALRPSPVFVATVYHDHRQFGPPEQMAIWSIEIVMITIATITDV